MRHATLTSGGLAETFRIRAQKVHRVGGRGSLVLKQRLERLAVYLLLRTLRVSETWDVWVYDDEQPNARWSRVAEGLSCQGAALLVLVEYRSLAGCVVKSGDDPNEC